jgi:hypothetical protein
MLQTERKQLEQHDWAEEATGGIRKHYGKTHLLTEFLTNPCIRNITERQLIHLNPRS